MMDQSLLDFIQQSRAQGVADEEIRRQLTERGWESADVAAGFQRLTTGAPSPTGSSLPRLKSLMKESLAILRARFWLYVALSILPTVAVVGVGFAVGVLAVAGGDVPMMIGIGVLLLVGIVIAIYAGLWSQVALILAIRDRETPLTLQTALRSSRPFIFAYFTTSLLAGALGLGGVFLFILPGVLISLWFTFASYALLVEGRAAGWDSLMRSRDLVAGRALQVAGTLIGMGIIVGLINWAARIPFAVLYVVDETFAEVVIAVVGYAYGVVATAYSTIFAYLLFDAVRRLPQVPNILPTEQAKARITQLAIGGYVLLAILIVLIIASI